MKDKKKKTCVDGKGKCSHPVSDLCIKDQNGEGCPYYYKKK